MDSRHARVSRFSKPTPPARAKRLQWKTALTWVQFPLGTTYDSYVERVIVSALPKVVGFLRVLQFPHTGNVDRVGWVNPNWPFHRSCAP